MVVYDVSGIVFKNRNVSDGKLLPYYDIKACGERGRQQVEGRSAASGGQPIGSGGEEGERSNLGDFSFSLVKSESDPNFAFITVFL